jgi:hypothetical protein
MQATVAVYTSWSIGSPEGDSVSFPWYFMRSASVIQYFAAPRGYNVCLRVGGPDVKIGFVPKFDVIRPVEFLSWLADNPCF